MFNKISRYRSVPDVTAPDAKGRVLAAKDVRLLPEVAGTFQHTVNAGDRLDQLAYKYYGQPLQWWNICDGNPGFLSPLAPLGRDPIVTTIFPVTISVSPPWAPMLDKILGTLGVEDVRIIEDVDLIPKRITADSGQTIDGIAEQFSRAVLVTYNSLTTTPEALAASINSVGFVVAPSTDLDQVGQQIVIPPRPVG